MKEKTNEIHRDRRRINENSGGKLSEYPLSLNTQRPDYTNFIILSWNANGIRPRSSNDKIQFICKVVAGWKPDFILLQETHLDKENEYFLERILPNYYWIMNNHTQSSRGVAIGIKRSKHMPMPMEEYYHDNKGRWIMQPLKFKGSQMIITSVYKPDKQGNEVWDCLINKVKEIGKERGVIVGGDFNMKPGSKEMTIILEKMASCMLSPVLSDEPTHGNGSQIDYIFIHDRYTTDVKPFLQVIPHNTDHGIIISGIRREKEKLHLPNPRISIELCENPRFIKEILEKTGKFHPKHCPFGYLKKIKEGAQECAKIWNKKSGHIEILNDREMDEKNMLKRMIVYHRRIKQYGNFPKEWMGFATIQSVIKEGSKRFKDRPKSTATCLELVRRIRLSAAKLYIDVPQLKIYNTKRFTNRAKMEWKPYCKATIVDEQGMPAQGKEQEHDILKTFWENTLGKERSWNKEIIDKLIRNHTELGEHEVKEFDEKEIVNFIKKRRVSAPGPDGIPMCLYANLIKQDHIKKLWKKIFNNMALKKDIPAWLVEGNLILLPKQDGIIGPDKYRPITVSNSDYRLMMGLWARRLATVLDPWITKIQKALLPNRNIRECVVNILDPWFQFKKEKKLVYLLQTDFAKAFDYINRDAIEYIMERMKMNQNLKNALTIALNPAPTYVCIPKTSPSLFTVRTGVKQGCPASPLMFIMVEDLLLNQLGKINQIIAIEAYADDVGILIDNKMRGADKIGEEIMEYSKGTGAQLNRNKCIIMGTVKEESGVELSEHWRDALRPFTTMYLGITIGTKILEKDRWEKQERCAKIIAAKMHDKKAPLKQKCSQINTYMISLYSYMQRHYLMPRSVVNNLSKNIRFALGSHNYIPDRVLFANSEPLRMKRPIIHPFFQGLSTLALSPTVPMIQTTKAICSKTILWHQQVARDIIDKKLKAKLSSLIYEDPYTNRKVKDHLRKAIRATLTRTLACTGMWKLIDQIGGTSRLCHGANFFKIKDNRHKMIIITVLCKGWSLKHQYASRENSQDKQCSVCGKEEETYKHVLEKCEAIGELLRVWKTKWDRFPPLIHKEMKWPKLGSDLLCAKEILNTKEITLRILIINLIHDVLIGCRKQEINMGKMEEEIRKIKWAIMREKRKYSKARKGGHEDNNELEQTNNEENRNNQASNKEGEAETHVEGEVETHVEEEQIITPPIRFRDERSSERILPINLSVDKGESEQLVQNNQVTNIEQSTQNNQKIKCLKRPQLIQWEKINEEMKSAYIGFFDGSGRMEPQSAGGGWVLYFNCEEISAGAVFAPYQTSNVGESMACAALLEHIWNLKIPKVNIFGDSKLIIDHLENKRIVSKQEWADKLITYQLDKKQIGITFTHIPRALNKRADAIANAAAISQVKGNIMAKEGGRMTRITQEEQVEKAMMCEKMRGFIKNPKKSTISFPIEDEYKLPIIGMYASETGIEEDFREIKYSNYSMNYDGECKE
jgi:exonuclease III/ribonuclease HI